MYCEFSVDVAIEFGDSSSNGSQDIYQRSRWVRGCGIFDHFLNFDHCQPEVVSDVKSGVVVDPRGVKVHVKFGDSGSNSSREMRLPHFVTNNDNNINDDDNDDDAGRRPL